MEGLSLDSLRSQLETSFVGRRVVYQESLSSTMDVAREEAEAGASEGTVVLAEQQTAGRGRLSRQWVSPPAGNIYVSIVLRPEPALVQVLAMLSPLAICRAIDEATGLQSNIKWPNDVLIGGRKVAGVLIDAEFSDGEVEYALVGIGVNVNFDPSPYEELREIATSLALELGRDVSREEVLAALLSHLEGLYVAARRGESVYEPWRARLDMLGREVRVMFADRVEEGVAEDVDTDGRLLLRRADGSTLLVAAGDVTLRI